MFKRFESWVEPFSDEEPQQPPKGIYAFCRHYTRGFEVPLVIMSILTALLAILEVSLFGFMGDLVDLLINNDPDTLFEKEGMKLLGMTLLVLIVIPTLVLLHALIVYQGLLGNYPMSIRWMAHRYLLKQSVSFYQNDFAGRVATKVMQTSLAVRETVTKLLDVLVYILVYFTSMVVMIAKA
ncbi:ABC transporter ATP-binding protein, partial [Shewanella sp. 0m-11]